MYFIHQKCENVNSLFVTMTCIPSISIWAIYLMHCMPADPIFLNNGHLGVKRGEVGLSLPVALSQFLMPVTEWNFMKFNEFPPLNNLSIQKRDKNNPWRQLISWPFKRPKIFFSFKKIRAASQNLVHRKFNYLPSSYSLLSF